MSNSEIENQLELPSPNLQYCQDMRENEDYYLR